MGAAESSHVVVQAPPGLQAPPAPPVAPPVHPSEAQPKAEEAERRRRQAQQVLRAAEEELYQQGYRKGQNDTLARIDQEAEVKTRGEFGRLQQDAERSLAQAVAEQAEALRKRGSRAPAKPLQCQEEETAVLQCAPGHAHAACEPAYAAYEACAERAMFKAMNPALR